MSGIISVRRAISRWASLISPRERPRVFRQTVLATVFKGFFHEGNQDGGANHPARLIPKLIATANLSQRHITHRDAILGYRVIAFA